MSSPLYEVLERALDAALEAYPTQDPLVQKIADLQREEAHRIAERVTKCDPDNPNNDIAMRRAL